MERFAIAASVLIAATSVAQPTVPNLRAHAARFAAKGVPAGFVVPESTMRGRPAPPPFVARPAQLESPDRIAELVEAFNQDRGSFRASFARGVIHIRRDDEPAAVTQAIEREDLVEASVDVTAAAILASLVLPLLHGEWTTESGGIIGSGGISAECPLGERVRIEAGRRSAGDLMDDVVRQVPGVAWFVTYDEESPTFNLKVGFVCFNGATTRFTR